MSEDMTYCENKKCTNTGCVRNQKNIKHFDIPHSFAHLEGNPLYCPNKAHDWNGNQYKGKED